MVGSLPYAMLHNWHICIWPVDINIINVQKYEGQQYLFNREQKFQNRDGISLDNTTSTLSRLRALVKRPAQGRRLLLRSSQIGTLEELNLGPGGLKWLKPNEYPLHHSVAPSWVCYKR